MDKYLVAVGTKRGPKLDAVRDALDQIAGLLAPGVLFEVRGFDVDSGVSHTPLSSAESMRGAKQRADALTGLPSTTTATFRYFIGMEGGLEVLASDDRHEEAAGNIHRRVFLESWAYVTDGTCGHFGRSGAIELPEKLAIEVLDDGVGLADAIDRFAGMTGIRDSQGAWGVLSRDLITRRDAFRVALIAAFAPFYNAALFRRVSPAG
jgi:inosine/xanthosine triphosphatase